MIKRLSVVLGTRPEAIKLAPIILELQDRPSTQLSVINTGQHLELSDQALGLFGISADLRLKLMQSSQSPNELFSRVMQKLGSHLETARPDLLIVHGDTASSAAAALVAFHLKIPVAHIEAGLRSGKLESPWPEEAYRQTIARLSSFHFSPTESAKTNLLREGISEQQISVTGNTVVDALEWIKKNQDLQTTASKILESLNVSETDRFLLLSSHRRENFGEPIRRIFSAVRTLAESTTSPILFPVHPNPNVAEPAREILGQQQNIHLLPPVNYLELLSLLSRCYFVLSDSGGIQEEAPSFSKPVLVLRENTERKESLEAGTSKLVGSNEGAILSEAQNLLENEKAYQEMQAKQNPYGDGRAAGRILGKLLNEKGF